MGLDNLTIITHRPLGGIGGVAVALRSLARDGGRVFAVDGSNFLPGSSPTEEMPLDGGGTQVLVRVPEQDYWKNYRDLANGILWPANHDLPEHVSRYSGGLVSANEIVLTRLVHEALGGLSGNGSLLVNDYQLTRFAQIMTALLWNSSNEERERLNALPRLYFHHTPFFSDSTFEQLAQHLDGAELQSLLKAHLEQLTYYNAVGVQTPRDIANLEYLLDDLFVKTKVSDENGIATVRYDGRKTLIKAVPIGVDPEAISHALLAGESQLANVLLGRRSLAGMLKADRQAGIVIAARVGRADYTKAYPENMKFFYEMAREIERTDPEFKGARFYVIAAETRNGVAAYAEEMKRITTTAEDINRQWRDDGHDYNLIELFAKEVPWEAGLALMRSADIYVDISQKDGMHLTPMEAIIAMGVGKGFIICGYEAGVGRLLESNHFLGGAHGVMVVHAFESRYARAAADFWRKGHRIDEALAGYVNNNTLRHWAAGLQELAQMAGEAKRTG